MLLKRKCTNPVSAEAFDIFNQREDSESCGNSWESLLGDSCGLSDCVSPGQCSFLELQAGNAGSSHASRNEKKIKLARLEPLVPEKLEKHLIFNSNQVRTFDDAPLEVVTHVVTKSNLGIRDCTTKDMDLDAVNSRLTKLMGKSEETQFPQER